MKLVLLVLLFCSAVSLGALSFEAEELVFTLQKGSWEMDGLFHFANYQEIEVSQAIYFPIPSDSLSLLPALLALEVIDASEASCQLIQQTRGGVSFMLSMPEKSFCTLRIAYQQSLLGNKAKYIITTANFWGKPLSYASYKLIVDSGITISKLPFAEQRITTEGYLWEFYEFSPQHEFELEFY